MLRPPTFSLNKTAAIWSGRTTSVSPPTPLGDFELFQKLLSLKSDLINKRTNTGLTALHLAAAEGHASVVKLLQAKGAQKSVRDHSGKTALHFAADHGHEEVVIMLAKSANITLRVAYGDAIWPSCDRPRVARSVAWID